MSFRGLLRPGQGFQRFRILRKAGGTTPKGRPYAGAFDLCGEFDGILTESSPNVVEQSKQRGTPITHTIVQRGSTASANDTDVLELLPHDCDQGGKPRRFIVRGDPRNPGGLGHFLVYRVEERKDLQ